MLASLNWSESDGFAQRYFNQNYFIDGPWVMNSPSGMSLNHFVNNTEGPLPMTPEWLIKVSGSYTIPLIETDFGFRLRYNSGRAVFPTETFPAYQRWMGGFDGCWAETCLVSPPWQNIFVAADPTNPGWLPSTTIVDLNLSKSFRLGKVGSLWASFDVLNATDENAATAVSTGPGSYGRVTGVVLPRRYRLGLKFSF
jgi:outer membrane receptor protein involved in Fe transport